VKAICESGGKNDFARRLSIEAFKIEFVKKVFAELDAQFGENPEEDPQAELERELQIFTTSYETVEKLMFGLLKEKGWSKDAVGKLVEKAKAIEISKIHPGDSIHPNRAKVLSSAPWVTTDVLKRLPAQDLRRVQLAVLSACGSDGMTSNAFATAPSVSPGEMALEEALDQGRPAVFIICPGLLLQSALNEFGPDSIVYAVGHELGHMLQPSNPVPGTLKLESPESRRKIEEAERAYEKAIAQAEVACPKLKGCFARKAFLSDDLFLNSCDVRRVTRECKTDPQEIQKKIAAVRSAAKDRQALVDQLTTPPGDTNRDRAYLSCLKRNDLNEMNNGYEQIAAFKKQTERLAQNSIFNELLVADQIETKNKEIAAFEKKWGRKPDSIDQHQQELVADYWGTQVLDGMLKELPDSVARKSSLSSNLSAFCELATTQSKSNDIENHPPFGYRFQRILSNPGIRSSLGCKSPPPRVWCER
jgi:hypothetical protein